MRVQRDTTPSDAIRRMVHNFNNNFNRPLSCHHGNYTARVAKIFLITCSKLMTEAGPVHKVTSIVTKLPHDRRDKITKPLRYRGHGLIL